MKNARFKSLSASLVDLSRAQIDKLLQMLADRRSSIDSSQAFSTHEPKACPHCGHALSRFGVRNGMQRFRCKDPACLKTCCATTGTPLNRLLGKDKLAGYAGCMAKGLTLRQTAKELGMSLDRAFRWRHRLLEKVVGHQPKPIAGLLEVDETYFQISRKGERGLDRPARKRGGRSVGQGRFSKDWVPVLVGRARGQAFTVDKVLADMSKGQIAAALAGSVDSSKTILCTDSHKSYLQMPEMLGVECNFFVTTKEKPEGFHVQNVNNYHERLKTWINFRLRGVATKYLPHYLAWQRMRTWKEEPMSPVELIGSSLGHQFINL